MWYFSGTADSGTFVAPFVPLYNCFVRSSPTSPARMQKNFHLIIASAQKVKVLKCVWPSYSGQHQYTIVLSKEALTHMYLRM